MKEPYARACECGSTIKVSSLDPMEQSVFDAIWKKIHRGHEPVSCAEAQAIRTTERRRQRERKMSC